MTVLVLGATGFIGAPLVRALLASGEEVAAASRRGGGPAGAACDRADVAAVVALTRERRVRTVVDLVAYTAAATLPLTAALEGRVERYILASSMDVYRNYEGLHRKADPGPILRPLDEASPLRVGRHPYRASPRRDPGSSDAWLDDYDKISIEEALRSSALAHTILRFPMVYGPGDRQRRFRWIVSPMLKGATRLTVDPAWSAWRTTYGFVDDVADAMARAALGQGARSGTFNVGDADPPDHSEWVARFARALGWTGAVEPRPAPSGSPIAALDLRYPLIADTGAFREAYAWREPTALDERLARTIADERARGSGPG